MASLRNQNARNRRTAGSRNQNIDDGPALVNILSERIPKYHPLPCFEGHHQRGQFANAVWVCPEDRLFEIG
jgi:hypothetical protein